MEELIEYFEKIEEEQDSYLEASEGYRQPYDDGFEDGKAEMLTEILTRLRQYN